jgi:DNA-binding NarL/FixJ family response regulator
MRSGVITVGLAEDHEMVREGFRTLLELEKDFRIVGEAEDGLQALELATDKKPDVLLLDLTLPRLHGLHVLSQLRGQKSTRVIVVTMHGDKASVLEALRLGALGYVLKDSPRTELVKAIRTVAQDEIFVSPKFESFLKERALGALRGQEQRAEALTVRERMVLQMIADGKTNDTAAAMLGISARTVEKHRANFMEKLGLQTHREIVLYALREGLLSTVADEHDHGA